MSEAGAAALQIIEGAVGELDGILKQANGDLNFAAAKERIAKWKARTIPVLAQHLGQQEAQGFADTQSGPSFTNDLLEELSDEVDVYRSFLTALASKLRQRGGSSSG